MRDSLLWQIEPYSEVKIESVADVRRLDSIPDELKQLRLGRLENLQKVVDYLKNA